MLCRHPCILFSAVIIDYVDNFVNTTSNDEETRRKQLKHMLLCDISLLHGCTKHVLSKLLNYESYSKFRIAQLQKYSNHNRP